MIDQVRPRDLDAWLGAVRNLGQPVVLDVREPAELRRASVQTNGFELIEMPIGDIAHRLPELDPERPVACLCHHGIRSMQVAAFLSAQGFARVANIAGGISAWSAEVDPGVPTY
jgi:rhodanese-related sulfurtransferase